MQATSSPDHFILFNLVVSTTPGSYPSSKPRAPPVSGHRAVLATALETADPFARDLRSAARCPRDYQEWGIDPSCEILVGSNRDSDFMGYSTPGPYIHLRKYNVHNQPTKSFQGLYQFIYGCTKCPN